MPTAFRAFRSVVLTLLACSFPRVAGAQTDATVPVVLISIDGLKPDYVLEADKHGLKIPNLRRMVTEGACASGVMGVLPTVTYPAHTTMVTGASPIKHGILSNNPFDPTGKNLGGWYWYAEDIRVTTLWDAAAQAGLVTASVDWPVTVGANITHNIPQYWRASTPDDHKILRVVSSPGLLAEAEQAVGTYPEGNDYTIAADRRRAAFNVFMLETKKPRFHLCYFSGLDTEQHRSGPYSAQAFDVLEQIDELVGQVQAAAEKIADGRAMICVVSDHGFARSDRELHLNAAFTDSGLIQLNERGQVISWRAFAWYAGGTAAIQLNEGDDSTRAEVRELLNRLAADPDAGIHRVIEDPDPDELGGFPGTAFLVAIRPGYRLGTSLKEPVLVPGRVGGTHGYLPEFSEMDASFFLIGPGVPAQLTLGRIDMRDIAPTLAGFLGVALPAAEGRNLLHATASRTPATR